MVSSLIILPLVTSFYATFYVAAQTTPSFLSVFVKLLPCSSLIFYIVYTQRNFTDSNWTDTFRYCTGLNSSVESSDKFRKSNTEELKKYVVAKDLLVGITRGLLLSMVGDAFLVSL